MHVKITRFLVECLTKVQKGERTQIVKNREFHADDELELVQTPKKSALIKHVPMYYMQKNNGCTLGTHPRHPYVRSGKDRL